MSRSSSSISLEKFNSLIDNIYSAALDMDEWFSVLESFKDSMNATSGLLRVQDMQSNVVGAYITSGIDPSYRKKYKEYYIHRDPLVAAVTEDKTRHPIQTRIYMPDSFRQTEFYNDYAVPQSMHNSACCNIGKNYSQVASIGVHRDNKRGVFTPSEMNVFNLLAPHIQRSVRTNQLLSRLTEQAGVSNAVLDRLEKGIILIDVEGHPVFINRMAEEIVAQECELSIENRELRSIKRSDTQALQKLIFNACRAEQRAGGVLSISSPASVHPLNIMACPIHRDTISLGFDSSSAVAILFIGSGGKDLVISLDVLCQLYGLTGAEARLCATLANGYSLEQIADKFGVTKHTIRSQLKSCFYKTGVKRQTELVKMVLSDPGVLMNGADSFS